MVIHIMKSLLQPQFQKVLALFLLSLVHVIGISDSLIFQTAYLHAQLEENIYAYPPEGVGDPDGQDHIWLLLKSLYGAKQSTRYWNHFLADLLILLDLHIGTGYS